MSEILFQFLDAKKELRTIDDSIEMIKNELLPKSIIMSGVPGSHDNRDRYAETMSRLDELYARLERQRREVIHKMSVVEELIERVDDSVYRTILYERYILGNKWEVIAEKMNYSPRRIFQLRTQAVAEVMNHIDDLK